MIKSLQGVLQIAVTFLLSYIVPLIHYLVSFVPKMKIRFYGFLCFSVWRKIKSGDVLIQIFNSVSVWSLFSTGYINEDRLRELLMTMGDRFTEDEVICSFFLRCDLGFVKWVGNSFYTTVFEKAPIHDRIQHKCKMNCYYNKGVSFVEWNTL